MKYVKKSFSALLFVLIFFVTASYSHAASGVASEEEDSKYLPYWEVGEFNEGYAWVYHDDYIGFVDTKGNLVIQPQFDKAYNFSEGLALVQKNGLWGFIDKNGKLVIDTIYEDAFVFEEGLAPIMKDGRYGYIDKAGKMSITLSVDIDGIYPFSNGMAGASSTGKWGFIDKTGKQVIKYQYDLVYNFTDGLAPVSRGGNWGYVDPSGKEVINLEFQDAYQFSEGLAAVQKNNKWGYIDKFGKVIIPFQYESAMDFKEGLAPVNIGGLWGYIDKTGKVVIKPQFDEVDLFFEGLAQVSKSTEYGILTGYIDRTGNEIFKLTVDFGGTRFKDGLAVFSDGGIYTSYIVMNPLNKIPGSSYNDFNSNEYWTEHMLWCIDKGLIKGYINQYHPSTGVFGNWLNPYGTLTESQFLTILFRYMYPEEFETTIATTDFWASIPYQMAAKYNLPTKGSLQNREPASKAITRGTLAQILASTHFKKVMGEKEAIQWMYDSGITTGYPDAAGQYPKTYESYQPKGELKRAQIVSFIKRYDDYINKK